MKRFRLTARQRRRLRAQVSTTRDVRVARRSLALLALDEGTRPVRVAVMFGVTRQTIYNWIARFNGGDGALDLDDRPRDHLPLKLTDPVQRFLRWSLTQPPDALGYPSGTWTVPLLREHVAARMGVEVSDSTMRRELHRLGYRWKRPRYVLQPDPDREKKRKICHRIRHLPPEAVVLAEDESDVLLFPPLRAAWAERGRQADVRISGRNARRVIFGAINLRSGRRVLEVHHRQRAQDFCSFLREIRRHYRAQPLALLLDEDSSHIAHASQKLAVDLDIRLLWLPKRSPELNPMDHLWRSVKRVVCANHQDANVDLTAARVVRYLRRLTPRAALVKAGTRSPRFWLRRALSNRR